MKFKRTISAAAAAAMLGTCGWAAPMAQAADINSPLIRVTFDDGGDGYTLHGGTLTQGRDGNALSLDGNEQYADINGSASELASITGDYTISVWCNPSQITTWARIYDLGNDTNTYAFLTVSNGSMPRYAVKKNDVELSFDSDTALTVDTWHNVTVTKEGNTSTFYVDGYVTGTSTAVTTSLSDLGTMANLYLGKSQFPADAYYSGLIDDFTVYDFALSETEVQTLAAEAYTDKKNAQIYENNCFVVNTHFYDENGTEIFAYDAEDFSPKGLQYNSEITADKADFTLFNADTEDISELAAYLAEYDASGVLSNLSMKTFTDSEITSASQSFSIARKGGGSAKLFLWNDMEPVGIYYPTGDLPTLSVTSVIENDTTETSTVKASAYEVDENGNEMLLSEGEELTLASLESKEITLELPVSASASKVIVKVDTGDDETYTAATLYCGIQGPVAAPADSSTTTDGAHDPSIVQFEGDDTYYVYSSHHLIFTSEDLINWKKYDFTSINASVMAPNTAAFIQNNYADTTMNGTYWAPDVIYVPEKDAEHPYWMYMSLSCGLGGRNSVISLVKSDSPLFWADPQASITTDEIVFATKESNSYVTNAIDANIYTDSNSGNAYFIYGSFWGGIQALPLTADGKVEGVNYTSDSTILSTCASAAKQGTTSIFTQKRGVAGPEGAWMYEYNGYRYCFTSYAWLGSNYNTRVARSPLSESFAQNTSTQLVDANGVAVGQEYSRSSGDVTADEITGYKLLGSYRLGDGSMTMVEDSNTNDWYYPRSADDAHIYYGSGHNSAITSRDGESFYCSHFRKDAVEGGAILQIRKLLYTPDGWPVAAAVSYAGEKEQALPEEMLYGTYDLASVGRTKLDGTTTINENWINHSGNRNYDLPVISSKVTLNKDKTVTNGAGAEIGTWSYDGDHTVVISFTADGDTSKDEFYKSGDTMTLLALYGYDKDEREPVIGLTGTDQNHITQLAKKSMALTYKTPAKTAEETEAISIAKSAGGNPELGFDADGNILYAGDPAATVIGDTVYLIAGHDTAADEGYCMPEWVLYTSKNMTDWEYKGVVMKATDISWRSNDTSAWASQMVEYNGRYYLYYCTWDKTSSGKQSIGVAVADSPEGPYSDIGAPLVKGTFTAPESSGWNDIDPTVLIDTDEDGNEHRYLAWGNGKYYVCELNEDMISVKDIDGDGEIVMNVDVKERKIKGMNGGIYTEAPWLYKRDGKYYLFYAMNWREEMAYAMADEPMGRYDFKQIIMPPTATSNTNHPSVIDFNGKTYFIYHNGALPHGSGFRRSVCIDELRFDENGYVYPVTETSIGLTGTASTIITSDNRYVGHGAFTNPLSDASYPITAALTVAGSENGYNTAWELMQPKSVPTGESADNYVSIQSVNKPGLYIASTGTGVTLTQDTDGLQGDKMTFKTVKGLDGRDNTVSFVSVSDPGKYLTVLGTGVTLSYGTTAADCSFIIGAATQKDEPAINIADIEPEPDPEPDITQDFESVAANTVLISLAVSDTPPYTALNGVTLYIGTRPGGANAGQNFRIQTGGVTGNALVLNAGSYQDASRGPRMAINTPVIPNGYTVTAEIQVKQGVSGSVLRYNDSTSDEAGTEITGLSTEWQTLKIAITNDNDTYKRTISLGDSIIATDFVDAFPVLWGTTVNSTGQSICFDDLSIKTTTASGEAPVITVPEPAAEYKFDGTLDDELSDGTAEFTGSTASAEAAVTEAVFNDSEDGQAVVFEGSGSYGLKIPYKLTSNNYTISFDVKLNTSAKFSPFVFIANFDGEALKGSDENAQWISIAPQGWQESLNDGPMIWSRDVTGGNTWNDVYTTANKSMALDKWQNITVTVSGTTGTVYVDGTKITEGNIAAIVDDTTTIFLGVNDWDTPLDGAIDNLRIYNKALSASQVKMINE
ncbi:MAG: family 43 glycosylhydrolase [Candidatus Ornithomonoglobus sp.]